MAKNKLQPLPLGTEVILVVETLELARFLKVFLQYLQQQDVVIPKLQIRAFPELTKLPGALTVLAELEGIKAVRKVVVVLAAGPSWRQTKWDLDAILMKKAQIIPCEIDYFLLPGKKGHYWQSGYLEDMLWQTLRERTAEECHYVLLRSITEDFILSVKNSRLEECQLKNLSRHKLYAYLAATTRYAGMNLAEAAQNNAFALEHPVFASLKNFLSNL